MNQTVQNDTKVGCVMCGKSVGASVNGVPDTALWGVMMPGITMLGTPAMNDEKKPLPVLAMLCLPCLRRLVLCTDEITEIKRRIGEHEEKFALLNDRLEGEGVAGGQSPAGNT